MPRKTPSTTINLAGSSPGHGYIDEALNKFDKAIRLDPGNLILLNQIASILIKEQRLDEALRYCERALGHQPDFFPALINAGSILSMSQRGEEALNYFRQAVAILTTGFQRLVLPWPGTAPHRAPERSPGCAAERVGSESVGQSPAPAARRSSGKSGRQLEKVWFPSPNLERAAHPLADFHNFEAMPFTMDQGGVRHRRTDPRSGRVPSLQSHTPAMIWMWAPFFEPVCGLISASRTLVRKLLSIWSRTTTATIPAEAMDRSHP